MSILPPGSRLGRFEISSVLGQGAMGVVYLAHDPDIDRPVAIKTIHPEAARGESGAEIEARFLKEAKLAGRLQHPSIVTVFDVGRDKDLYFIAMEYVEGKPLTRYLGGEELPLAAKVAIIRQAAEALAHAHERDVVHRDVKPGNILIGKDGRVKVTDFGIGKFTSATTSDMTRTGQMIGSPAYMSPEQIRGEKIDGRSDLFSLGVVLYELLTGTRPFPGESITTLVYQILHTEPRDPREIRSDLPIATREVMARLLAKQPERRPADAREFLRELRRIEKFQRESEMTRRAVAAGPAAAGAAVGSVGSVAAPPPLPTSRVPAPGPPPEPVSSGAPTAPAARSDRRIFEGTIFLLAGAAIAAALIFFLVFRRPRTVSGPIPLATSTPISAAAAPTVPAAVPEAVPVEPTPIVLPTPGPGEAADATVGASRLVETPVGRRARTRPSPVPTPEPPKIAARAEVEAPPPPASSAPARPTRVDAVYETRGSVRFTSSPEQARLYVDGHYVGIADDWDNRGGGRPLELEKDGTHYVRMELPGYRPMNLQIDVTPDANDSVSIDEELERRERLPYEKLPAVYDRTTAEVEFEITPADAGVSEDGKALGQASDFGPASPLKLSGPRVHDLMLSAPGYKPRLVRILVAPNAGKPRAKVSEKLKTP
jgi:predicted Ser/Thr protein kinase